MGWWWRKRSPDPEPAVTDEDRDELDQVRDHLATQRDRLAEVAGEAKRRASWIRREVDENHLAERVRRALEGLS